MRNRHILPCAIILCAVIITLWKPIFRGDALLPGGFLAQMRPYQTSATPKSDLQWNPLAWDAIAQFHPWRMFYAESLKSGCLPLWNPHQACGTPFVANGQSAVFYPFNLIYLFFDPITAGVIFAAFHLWLAGVFTYFLMLQLGCGRAGALLSGIAYSLSGFMIASVELPTFISAAAWLPCVLLLIEISYERESMHYGLLAGGALGMAFLAGHLQISMYVGMAAGLWWIWKIGQCVREEGKLLALRDAVAPLCAFAICAFLVAAPQVLPSMELGNMSHRVRELSEAGYRQFVSVGFPAHRFITMFDPIAYGAPVYNIYFLGSLADYMEYACYVGIAPILLAIISLFGITKTKNTAYFAALAAISLLIACGAILNKPLYYHLPGYGYLGGPHRIILLFMFALACLAGMGVSFLQQRVTSRKFVGIAVFVSTAILIGGIVAANDSSVNFIISMGIPPDYYNFPGWPIAILLLSIIITPASAILFAYRDIGFRTFAGINILLTIAALFAFGQNSIPTAPRATVYPQTRLTRWLQTHARTARCAPINTSWSLYKTPTGTILPPNSAMAYGYLDFQGYDSLFTREFKDLSSEINAQDSSPIENGNMIFMKSVTPDALKYVKYLLVRADDTQSLVRIAPGVRKIESIDGIDIYESPSYPKSEIIWRGPNRFTAKNTTLADLKYLLPQSGYPGWKITADAKSRTVRGSFEPMSVRFGVFLGTLGIGLIAFTSVYRIARRGGGFVR